jgi:hypothetical protein
MNNIQKRFVLFSICILVRVLIGLLAYYLPEKYVYYMSFPAVIISLGFFVIYFGELRETGREVLGDKIWWNSLRPIHGLNYVVFAYMAFKLNKKSYIPLLLDVIIGLISFMVFHYNSNNFKLLLR